MNLDMKGMGEAAGDGRVAGGREVMGVKSSYNLKVVLWKFIFLK